MIPLDRDSIEHEPHLRSAGYSPDASEQKADRLLRREAERTTADDDVEHSVWDEPTLSPELSGAAGEDQLTYASWLEQKLAETSPARTWWVTLLVILVAGPWGVIGALLGGGDGTSFATAMVVLFGPVTEEIMKVAAALWIVEKRPYLFQSKWQILACAIAGGAAFSVIENLIYLHGYVPQHSAALATWRWTVCVGLHMNCSFIAGVGLARIWDNAIRNRRRPEMALGVPWFVLAMVGHGLYNGIVIVAERAGWLPF